MKQIGEYFDRHYTTDGRIIRRNVEKGIPCGSDRFIKKLEKQIERVLQYRPPGRPAKPE